VPAGSTVRFPNQDVIVHNVFSVSPGNRFDLGRYGEGEGRSTRLDRPGLVRVYCNVHHSMVAYVLVVATPYVASPDTGGAFRLTGLPAGKGRLTVWHERAGSWSQPLEVPASAPVLAKMTVTQRRPPPHLDKHGKPYREQDSGEDYK
jgi:hypothetical protein